MLKGIPIQMLAMSTEIGARCTLEPKDENKTLVKITESDWLADYKGANKCMGQVEGWTNFLCCLKAYLEYGINLRLGAFIK